MSRWCGRRDSDPGVLVACDGNFEAWEAPVIDQVVLPVGLEGSGPRPSGGVCLLRALGASRDDRTHDSTGLG